MHTDPTPPSPVAGPLPAKNTWAGSGGVRWYKSIEFKIILSVAITTLAVNGFFTFLYLDVQARHLDETILKSATRLSETIKKSIQYDMLVNRKENAYRIMETIAEQEGIEKVRIYGREGTILFSTDKGELGTMVDKKAEACYACHAKDTPIEKLSTPSKNRIFASGKGYRILGMINPIYNDRNCSAAECHSHPESQKVLGVIDITMSLAGAAPEIPPRRRQIIVFNFLSILSISVIAVVSLLVFVGKPVRQLVLGTNRVARGDLTHVIPIDSDDEMGHLARSFNQMTASLQRANDEIHEWIRTLEQKVEERTRELKDAQFQLLHTEKLAAVGKIAATVAHEINNPLTGGFTYIKLMERRVEKRMDPLPDIPADPAQMKQVFINLIINACEAMEGGGVLTVTSRHDGERNTETVAFADTGPGISPEDLPRVFDPFYTTKEKGTGLGLSVVYGIVTRHNGRIEVKSNPGGGTQMVIVLPTD